MTPSFAPPEGRGARMPGMSVVELYLLGWHNPLFQSDRPLGTGWDTGQIAESDFQQVTSL